MSRTPLHDRAETLNKAMRLFWRKGYHATSLKDLEATLDMRPGSIYAAFKSKEGLFRQSLALYFDQMSETFTAMLDDAPTALDGLSQFVHAHVDAARQDPPDPACLLLKTTLELNTSDGASGQEARAFLNHMTAKFAEALTRAQDNGELPEGADPDRLARRIQVKLIGLTVFLQKETDDAVIDTLAEDLRREILSLGAQPITA